MKQRLGIAQALIHDPALLICDEPTSALDPLGRSEILQILGQVRGRTTVLFSTHILADVERICDTVGVLDGGKLALGGNLEQIKSTHRRDTIVLELDGLDLLALESLSLDMQTLSFVTRISITGTALFVDVGSVRRDGLLLQAELLSRGLTILNYHVQEPTLENLYLDVIA
jgi:ABC-2 type transport system ATP-binding protein